ncbi:uncharacterized protein [Miscanthus floridulus]|uniref:uncharacterized protein isoform X2 n=1 Tax=Miscanthus floridulus TaxID=154761 RepID=UPI003457AF80
MRVPRNIITHFIGLLLNRCPSVLCVSFRVEIASKVQKSVVQSGSFSINCRPAMICRLHCWLQGSGLYCCFFDISNVQGDAQLAKVSVRIPTSTDGTTAILKSQKLNLTSTGNSNDRSASIQAVLFAPYLLAGLTHGKLPVTDNHHSNDGLTLSIWEVNAANTASVAG